jgi:nucleotide-binding universal stress UspA family protein
MTSAKKKSGKIRILVPTDLSAASRAGIRYAIQWSRQQPADLVFCYVVNILKPPAWSDARFRTYANSMRTRYMKDLRRFVANVYSRMGVSTRNASHVLLDSISVEISLVDYCRREGDFDYICISTRGAGKMRRIFGTHTGNLITHSEVPVMAVPREYRIRPIKRLLYAGDMVNYADEMQKVVNFAKPFKAETHLLHFTEGGEITPDEATTGKIFQQQFGYPFRVHFRPMDQLLSFSRNLDKQVSSLRPSVVVLFTNQHRSLLDYLANPSRAERVSFALRTPLLVFPKK